MYYPMIPVLEIRHIDIRNMDTSRIYQYQLNRENKSLAILLQNYHHPPTLLQEYSTTAFAPS